LTHKNILYVDDSCLAAKLTSNFLLENGYQVETVSTAEAAIEKVCTLQVAVVDLILMDIELGSSMNGIEAAHEILKRIDIPIVFLTANSSKAILNKIKEVDAYGFVLKGMDKIALLSTIEMAFHLHDAIVQTKDCIEELRQANEEVEAKRIQYLQLCENAPVGILKCDEQGTIGYINQKALDILGSPDKEKSKKINLLTFPTLVQYGFSAQLEDCIRKNQPGVYEMNYKSIWGKEAFVRLHIKPITDRYRVIGAQIIMDDVTEKKRLERELQKLSVTDPLTNVYNRRYFIRKMEEEIERVQRNQTGAFCVAMLDVDHFKAVNDCFGHNVGDMVLKQLTETIKKRIRKIDCLARWGGEEFMLLLPGTHVRQAVFLVEDLRKRISNMQLSVDGSVTASFGVIEYEEGDTVDSMIQKTDQLLYEAKKQGRNCVRSLAVPEKIKE
jgi:diguanylate cyclase (GGDEF)-like protein/PAS domain S-box-containing protein